MMIIPHEKFNQGTAHLQHLYDAYGSLKEYERGYRIYGPPGTGKTFIMEVFAQRYQPTENDERTIRPVVWVSVKNPKIDAVLATLLAAFGIQNPYTKNTVKMIDTLIQCIHNSQTRLLGIDEASMIAEYRADKTVRFTADLLKTLINNTYASVVCLGVETLQLLYKSNAQFRDRFSKELDTHAWGIRKEKTIPEFVTYVMTYAKSKNIEIPETNAGVSLITGILYATDGRQRKVHQLIDLVHKISPQSAGENLNLLFLEAFKEFANSNSTVRNPFDADFNKKELVYPGELYGPENIKL